MSSREENNYFTTLQQGYQFNQNQIKIVSNENDKMQKLKNQILLAKVSSAEREDYREIGYPNVGVGMLDNTNFYDLINKPTSFKENFQNMNSSILTQKIPVTHDIVQSYFSELDDLDKQFNSVLEQYNSSQLAYTNQLNSYVEKNSANTYQNKNISLANGKKYYVNSKNVAKPFSTNTIYTNTQNKNNCPANITNIGTPKLPGDLIVGSNMIPGQSCGNEGMNVYVSEINSKPVTNYVGCYKDSSTAPTMTSLSNGNSIYDYDTCMKLASDHNSPYFSLENRDSVTGLASCNIGNNLNDIEKYGVAYNITTNSVWSSKTEGTSMNTMVMTNQGNFILQNNSNQQTLWTSNPASANCLNGGMIQPGSLQGSYGMNCNSQGYNVTANNASNALNKSFGNTPQSSWSFGMNNENLGDPASGCGKTFTASYICGSNNIKNIKGDEGQNAIFDCNESVSACIFYILLNDNGNLCLFQGLPGSNTNNYLWCSNTNTSNTKGNPEWVSQKGKYGVNYIKTGQTLAPGEWMGSPNGNARLIMDTDGALRIYASIVSQTPNCTKTNDGKMIGNENTNAVYSLVNNGDPKNVGKIGYVNSNSQISEYPLSMISSGDDYIIVNGFNSIGDTLENGIYTNTTVQDCETKCNSTQNCVGFVFDESTSIGELKSKIYPLSSREPDDNKNIHVRKMKVSNSNSCSKQIVEIDSVMWKNYPAAANQMTPATKCGISQELEKDQNKVNELKKELNTISSKIVNTVNKMTSMNLKINEKMGMNKKSLDDYIQKYNTTKTQISENLGIDEVNTNAILADKNIYVLEENYKYMLWSTLAIAGVILTINILKSSNK